MIREPSSNTKGGGAPREEEAVEATVVLGAIFTIDKNDKRIQKKLHNIVCGYHKTLVPGLNTVLSKRYMENSYPHKRIQYTVFALALENNSIFLRHHGKSVQRLGTGRNCRPERFHCLFLMDTAMQSTCFHKKWQALGQSNIAEETL
jgi:hypothetical protein